MTLNLLPLLLNFKIRVFIRQLTIEQSVTLAAQALVNFELANFRSGEFSDMQASSVR